MILLAFECHRSPTAPPEDTINPLEQGLPIIPLYSFELDRCDTPWLALGPICGTTHVAWLQRASSFSYQASGGAQQAYVEGVCASKGCWAVLGHVVRTGYGGCNAVIRGSHGPTPC
jgi:hypothetical protein